MCSIKILYIFGPILALASLPGDSALGSQEASAVPKQNRVDRYGDPLPEHAIVRIGTVRWRHAGVTLVSFAPDGQTVASAGDDGAISLWETATGKQLARYKVSDGHVHSLAFSPDGKMIAGAIHDHSVRLLHAATGKPLHSLNGHGSAVVRVAFHADGKTLVSVDKIGEVRHWDVTTGNELARFLGQVGGQNAPCVALPPDCKSVTLWDGRIIRQWDVLHFPKKR